MDTKKVSAVTIDPFAIVGLSFKMPQEATNESGFWKILEERKNLSSEWPKERINMDALFKRQDEPNSRGAHFLNEDPGVFDAPFFSISPKEAAAMDPQQRMALEVAYHAFENAGIPAESLRGSRTGVFGATMADDYARMISKDVDTAPPLIITGGSPGILPNRVSWFFDLRGPSVHVDTACSSSMIAVDMACQAMRSGNATAALIIGSNLLLSPEPSMLLEQGNFLSPDSKCWSFDARANGYARGEGIVALVVKPLSIALENGDIIRAVIRGTGSNQDGRTPTLTQPSAVSQEALIRRVYKDAKLRLDDTRYIEAHGTGTAIGDPIELSAIGNVFGKYRSPEEPLFVGSVKANIGHLEGASGGAGIIKAILALEKGIIPPNALFERMNPAIDAEFYNVHVPIESIPWPSDGIRRISVNSFGYGGTNSHVILDDALHYLKSNGLTGYHHCIELPSVGKDPIVNGVTHSVAENHINGTRNHDLTLANFHPHRLLIWSAADASALQRMTQKYQEYYQTHVSISKAKLDQLAYTLTVRRSIMQWRTFAVASGQQYTTDNFTTCKQTPTLSFSQATKSVSDTSSIAFVFTGQGAQYVDMGMDLLKYSIFEQSLQRSDKILHDLGCTWSIFDEMRNDRNINLPEYSQPLCTVLQIALVDLLSSFGITASAVVGHSSGEIAAAYTTSALSQVSACKVAYFRGKVTAKLRNTSETPGAMISVNISESEASQYLEKLDLGCWNGAIHVACVNSPTNITLSGPSNAIDIIKRDLDEKEIFAHKLNTGVAYHSPAMSEVADEYASLIGILESEHLNGKEKTPFMISSVTGSVASQQQLADPRYWVNNMISPVQFTRAIHNLSDCLGGPSKTEYSIDLIEIGPHAALRRPIKDSNSASIRYHSILERNKSPLESTLILMGTLFCSNHPVSVLAVNQQVGESLPFLVDCPSYPFDHSRRYWSEPRFSKDYKMRPNSPGYMLGRRSHDWNALRPEWRNFLHTEAIPWLGDHKISDTILCPGTGMVVMAIEAVRQGTNTNNSRSVSGYFLKDAQFLAPITVGETAQNATETVLHLRPIHHAYEKESSWYEVDIFTYREERWTECFRAEVQVQYEEAKGGPIDGGLETRLAEEQLRDRCEQDKYNCKEAVGKSDFYDFCARHGIYYGESFQLLQNIAWDGHEKSVANIDMTNLKKDQQKGDSSVHPAVLDACIQLILVQISKGATEHISTYIPQRIANTWISSKVFSQETSMLHISSTLRPEKKSSNSLTASFWALTDDGFPLCSVEEVVLTEVSKINVSGETSSEKSLLYNIAWKPQLSSLETSDVLKLCDAVMEVYDETFEEEWSPKAELAMTLAARKALKIMTDEDLELGPAYFRRYVSSLEYLYGARKDSDVKDMGDLELDSLLTECEIENPECRVFLQIARSLPSILRGETDPLDLIFTSKSAENLYTYLANQQMRDGRFSEFLNMASHETPTLKILEVGAGTGSMARHVLGALKRFETSTGQSRFASYTFTDISPTFFESAQQEFGDFQGRLSFKTLDLERDLQQQGFGVASYDLVIAGLVFHATSNVSKTLERVHQLLKPGGHISFQEVTAINSARANVTFGSLEGWWLSTEEWRQHTPLLTVETWDELLLKSGYTGADCVFRDYQSDKCHLCSMIVAKKVDQAPRGHISAGELSTQTFNSMNQQGEIFILVEQSSDVQCSLAAEICRQSSDSDLKIVYLVDGAITPPPSSKELVVSLLEVDISYLSALSEIQFPLFQALLQTVHNVLWVSSLPAESGMSNPHAAIATGFLRTLRTEEPGKHVVSLLGESGSAATTARQIHYIVRTCFRQDATCAEIEFMSVNGLLTIGRLIKEIELDSERLSRLEPSVRNEPWKPGPALVLEVGIPGMLDTLQFVEDSTFHEELASGEVEIEAVAWPVSFRDVFVALGRLGMEQLGVECAGIVKRTGWEVKSGLKCGDRVVMLNLGCMRSNPRCLAEGVIKIPDNLSFNEAAAAINPGITAYYSLINVARLQAGEKILIHSGAGSTGQMAIALAQWLGAEVFTTVGFADKKKLLMNRFGIPESHIFYSRDTSFSKGIMRITEGYGVDVVLNSLSGEGLRASWECIAPYGRFVEMGKSDIGVNSSLPMASFSRNTSFAAVDLVHLTRTKTQLVRGLIEEILSLLSRGEIDGPNPLHLYPLSSVEKAFRYMQSGTNTGRIILTAQQDDLVPRYTVLKSAWKLNANASYIVVGGFGGIGRAILRWMADRGAKFIIVPSTSGPSSEAAQDVVSKLTSRGVRIISTKCDVASAEDLERLLKDCATSTPPIKGCINSAMVLQDSIFWNMTHKQWSRTIRSKINTSWNLHQLLPKDLDFFILLSSIAGIYGSPGQSNYAAGCAFQDALARSRAAANYRCSVSFNLGWMKSIGIIAEKEEYRRNRRNAGDMAGVEDADFLALLEHYCDPSLPSIDAEHSQIIIGVVTQAHFHARGEKPSDVLSRPLFAGFDAPHLYEVSKSKVSNSKQEDPSELFREATTLADRSAVVVAALKAKLARTLDIPAEQVDTNRSLSDYGTDSLMAVELRNWIRKDFGVTVAIFDIMGSPDILRVGELVASRAKF